MKRVAVLFSGQGTNLQALAEAARTGALGGRVVLADVVASHSTTATIASLKSGVR